MSISIFIRSSVISFVQYVPLTAICSAVRCVIEQKPPELTSEVIDQGMILTGGGALLHNLDHLLTQETGVPCYVAERPLDSVAIGAGKALDVLEHIWRNLPMEDRSLATMA